MKVRSVGNQARSGTALAAAHAVTFVGGLVRGRLGAHRCDHGATATEYALMVSLIAVVIIASVTLFGQNLIQLFNVPSSSLTGP